MLDITSNHDILESPHGTFVGCKAQLGGFCNSCKQDRGRTVNRHHHHGENGQSREKQGPEPSEFFRPEKKEEQGKVEGKREDTM